VEQVDNFAPVPVSPSVDVIKYQLFSTLEPGTIGLLVFQLC
jgi:hypothetical protein